MMRGRLFWKIFLSYVGLIIFTAAVDSWLGVGLAVGLGLYVAYRITRPLRELTLTAGALQHGDYERRIHQLPPNEFGVLGNALNQLGATVARTIATIDQERSQLAAIIAGMVEGVVATDDTGRVIFCNQSAAALLQTTQAEMLGQYWWETTRAADLVDVFERAQRDTAPIHAEATLPHAVQPLTVQATASRFVGARGSGVVIVLNDLTQLKRLERIRQDFVANVSHELKTPLTAIRGYVETLLHSAKDDAANRERFLHKIDTQVGRLSTLVEELLTLARIEESESRLPTTSVDWAEIVRAVVERYEAGVADKALQLRVEIPLEPVMVAGNSEALSVITSNLLDNAIKYTPKDGTITLRLTSAERGICLAVTDTGIGISAHEQTRIFERFYRADKSRTLGPHGSGLGLAIVKHLVQALHGDMTVDSAEGRGSVFAVVIPK